MFSIQPAQLPVYLKTPVVEAAETPVEVAIPLSTPQEIEAFVRQTAIDEGIPVYSFVETLRNESMDFTALGQSYVPSKNGPNGREDSWGVCQIHLPSHPDITKNQATDVKWCVKWSAKEFKQGRASQWTEFRKLANK